jgi:hypothetical protein
MTRYVYYLRDPQNVIRHIGQTVDPIHRLYHYFHRQGHAPYIDQWISSILDRNELPRMQIICVVATWEEAVSIESQLIPRLIAKGVPLLNRAIRGGTGGWTHSEKSIELMRVCSALNAGSA